MSEEKKKGGRGAHLPKAQPKRIINAFEEEYFYYVLNRVNRRPSIQNSRQPFFPQRYSHPGIDVVRHPETGLPCTIRYIPGENSIFKDEQSRDATDRSCTPIIFEEGLCKVARHEENLKLFLDLCNANKDAKGRDTRKNSMFHLYNPMKTAEASYDKELETAKALVYMDDKCKTDEGIQDLIAYAETLMINVSRGWSEIKADLSIFLKRDPKKFLAGLESPAMKRKYIVMQALKNGTLIKDSNTGTISWANGEPVCTPPIGKDSVDYFVEWSVDKGENTYQHIKEETERLLLERV